jgi:hypothetical protein
MVAQAVQHMARVNANLLFRITSGTVTGAFWSALAPIGVENVETSENG